jgi:hypothetical protein
MKTHIALMMRLIVFDDSTAIDAQMQPGKSWQ